MDSSVPVPPVKQRNSDGKGLWQGGNPEKGYKLEPKVLKPLPEKPRYHKPARKAHADKAAQFLDILLDIDHTFFAPSEFS